MSVPYGSQLSGGVVGSLRLSKTTLLFVRRDESASETKYGVSWIRLRPDKLLRSKGTQALGVTRNWPRAQTSLVARNRSRRLLLGVSFSNSSKLLKYGVLVIARRNRIKRVALSSANLLANSRCRTLVVGELLVLGGIALYSKLRSPRNRALVEIALSSLANFL